MRSIFKPLFVFCFFFVSGCSSSHDIAGRTILSSGGSSLEQQSLTILADHCASCHTSANQGNINYILNVSQLRSKGLVVDGLPNASKLYNEVSSGDMPLSYTLTANEINTLKLWIESLDSGGVGLPEGTFQDVKAITDAKCLSCHNGAHQIPLTNYTQISATVWPGNPDASLLYDSVFSGRMPKTGPLLTADEISKIKGWILRGALDN